MKRLFSTTAFARVVMSSPRVIIRVEELLTNSSCAQAEVSSIASPICAPSVEVTVRRMSFSLSISELSMTAVPVSRSVSGSM